MKHFAYKENGQFNGFYTEEIHGKIPENSVLITEELWQELLKDNYRFKTNVLVKVAALDISDKDTYFEKVMIETTNIQLQPNPQELLAQQFASLVIENKKKDMAMTNLAKTVAELNIKISKMGGTN